MRITVAIPTIAGREKYLEPCVKTCTTQDFDDFDILVSDNSVDCSARGVVSEFRDSRIKYISPPEYMPMSRHWDFVLSQVTGDVVCIIGDDDGLMPGSIRRASQLIAESPGRIIHHSLSNYFWPDYVTSAYRNSIVNFHQLGCTVSAISGSEVLRGLCGGRLRYVDGPMVYHNFVPIILLRQLTRNGVFFRRSSPDVYSAVALAANVESFISTQECLTLSGQGARANGASVVHNGMDGSNFLIEAQRLFEPRFDSRTIALTLLDSILEVADQFEKPQIVDDIAYASFLKEALGEVAAYPGWRLKTHEALEVLRISLCNGVFPRTLADAARILCHLMHRGVARTPLCQSEAASNNDHDVLAQGSRLRLSHSVSNIYEASMKFAETIRENQSKRDFRL